MDIDQNLLLYLIAMIVATMGIDCMAVPIKPVRLCGVKLQTTLGIICNHNYNRPSWDRINSDYDAMIQRKSMRKRSAENEGIVGECCLKICTREQLRAYCGNVNEYIHDDMATQHRVADRSAELPRSMTMSEIGSTSGNAADSEEMPQTALRSSPLIGTVAPDTLRLPTTIGSFWI